MRFGITYILYFIFRDLFSLLLSQNLIKKVQFGPLNLNVQSALFSVSTSFPNSVHIYRLVPFLILPEKQCEVFLAGCFLPPRVTNIRGILVSTPCSESSSSPMGFRQSSGGSEMIALGNVWERNNSSISPISSIFSHWIYLSYKSPRHYCCQKNRKEMLY